MNVLYWPKDVESMVAWIGLTLHTSSTKIFIERFNKKVVALEVGASYLQPITPFIIVFLASLVYSYSFSSI